MNWTAFMAALNIGAAMVMLGMVAILVLVIVRRLRGK